MSHSSGQPVPAPVGGAPSSPGPPTSGLGAQSPVPRGRPPRHLPAGSARAARQPQVRRTGAERTQGSGLGAARGRACHWAPDGLRLHKAQGGGGRGARRVTAAGPRGRRMREARVWGHRCHRGRRLERGAQSPERPRAAAKDGLDRRAARRPRTPAPTRGSAPGPRQSLTRPGADISVPSFRTGVNPGSKAQKLPPYRGESKQREPAGLRPAGRALGALLGPLRLQSTLPPGGQGHQRDGRTSTTPRLRNGGLAPTTPAVPSGPRLWAAAPARPRH